MTQRSYLEIHYWNPPDSALSAERCRLGAPPHRLFILRGIFSLCLFYFKFVTYFILASFALQFLYRNTDIKTCDHLAIAGALRANMIVQQTLLLIACT